MFTLYNDRLGRMDRVKATVENCMDSICVSPWFAPIEKDELLLYCYSTIALCYNSICWCYIASCSTHILIKLTVASLQSWFFFFFFFQSCFSLKPHLSVFFSAATKITSCRKKNWWQWVEVSTLTFAFFLSISVLVSIVFCSLPTPTHPHR